MKKIIEKLENIIGSIYWVIKATTPAFIFWITGIIVNERWYMILTIILGIFLFAYGLILSEKDEIKFIEKTIKELKK